MLKQRIITAMILIPLFLLVLFALPSVYFVIMTTLLVGLAAWEWSGLMGLQAIHTKLIFPLLILLLLYAALWVPFKLLFITALLGWIIAIGLILSYPNSAKIWSKSYVIRGLMGVIVLVPCWMALNIIRFGEHGSLTLFFLFILIWGADTGAYFTGKKWGKTKLLPLVSPGKSVQGLMGALLTSLVITVFTLLMIEFPVSAWGPVVLLALVTVLFSVVGDLFESMLKRNENLKDSGNLLPGHGGILDRIDSLTAAAPIFVLGTIWLVKIK